ncbi:MAG: hypothetical protein ACJ8D5_09500 [Sphingomicrobium sp.]
MTVFRTLLLAAALAAGLTSAPALADRPRPSMDRPRPSERVNTPPPRDADRAFEAMREGRSMPLPQLERKVMPFMGGADYLGPELNGGTYRFKFMQNGRVIWVDVDAQSGRIIRRSKP